MADKSISFVLLAKGARGKGLCDLICKATSEPLIFTFGELLDVSNISDVRMRLLINPRIMSWAQYASVLVSPTIHFILQMQRGDLAPHYRLLQLFAYGTWPQYKGG